MNISTAKAIAIDIILASREGRKRYECVGKAYIDAGYLVGELVPVNCAASLREQVLLTAFTFTGCPLAARLVDDVVNPWRQTGGAYEAKRVLRSNAFLATSALSAIASDGCITISLNVLVEGELPSVIAIKESFSEQIHSAGPPGYLQGEFNLAFLLERENRVLPAFATTEYRLPGSIICEPTHRNITIEAISGGHTLHQVEQIDLYRDGSRAAIDLAARRSVESKIRQASGFNDDAIGVTQTRDSLQSATSSARNVRG